MRRLTSQTLSELPPSVRRPRYDRAALRIGMAHVGVGAFHRCHQAEFTDDMLEARFGDWGVLGVNLYAPRLEQILAPQDHLYSRTLRQGAAAETRVVGSLLQSVDVIDAASADAAVAGLAAPSLSVVTMTVTEKGYGLTPASGKLDFNNADVRGDQQGAWPPRTVLGLLSAALERRRVGNAPPLTLISCDNIPSNGALLRSALLAFTASRSAPLTDWIETKVAFPCTMVDRIVPATTREELDAVAASLGVIDAAAVGGERFRQWVIEDQFAGDRPPWDLGGAQFVKDAKPYEKIKMRLLNAAQSTFSHLGALLGHEFSFEAAADPVLSTLVRRMLERETMTTVPILEGMEAYGYIATSLSRIGNAAIRHRCHQIATDGSQKIVQRLIDPLRERLSVGQDAPLLTLAVAGWIAYCLAGAGRFGALWTPSDPWAAAVISLGEQCLDDYPGLAMAVLGIEAIFGADLATPEFCARVGGHLRGLLGADPRGYLGGIAGDE